MILLSFTKNGAARGDQICDAWKDGAIRHVRIGRAAACAQEDERAGSVAETVGEAFRESQPLIFVGATGIAVRSIAPHLSDKRTDPPVLAVDETGRFVIPLVSGHLGGANELARQIADIIGATPVISTATDLQDAFAVDLFAKEQQLGIVNREGIAKVSSKALEGRPVTLSVQHFPPKEPVDVLVVDGVSDAEERGAAECGCPDAPILRQGTIVLTARRYVLGIGCRKGKEAEAIRACAERALERAGIAPHDVAAIASIDRKAEEPGITALSRHWHVPFLTFDADLLNEVDADVASSAFVREQVGTDNVCERAALLGAGAGSMLVLPRQAEDGVTVAVARRPDTSGDA